MIPSYDLPFAIGGVVDGWEWTQCRKWNDTSAVWAFHVRDPDTGRIVNPVTRPTASFYPGLYYGYRGYSPIVGKSRGYEPNNAHMPQFGVVPYLATGPDFDLEEMMAVAAYEICWQNAAYRGYETPVISGSQTRSWAWQLRSVAFAAALLPTGHPDKTDWESVVQNSFDTWWTNSYAPGQSNNNMFGIKTEIVYTLDGTSEPHAPGFAPWQMNFLAMTLHQAYRMGFTYLAPWRDFHVSFSVNLMTQGCYQIADFYAFRVLPYPCDTTNKSISNWYTSWSEFTRENLLHGHYAYLADQADVACGQKDVGNGVGYMHDTGRGDSNEWNSYAAIVQPALAAGVDAGLADADTAWSLFQQWSDVDGDGINYSPAAGWSIVPAV